MFITKYLLFILLAILVYRAARQLVRGMLQGMDGRQLRSRTPERGVRMARDPVCGMFVVPSRALRSEDRGEPQYFCSEKCRAQWELTGPSRARASR